jgi:hypothetical protein
MFEKLLKPHQLWLVKKQRKPERLPKMLGVQLLILFKTKLKNMANQMLMMRKSKQRKLRRL